MHIIDRFLNTHKDRIIGLDILRSIAILIVVYGHGKFLIPEKYYSQYQNFNIFQIDGVSIFFVLSGFLIGKILLRISTDTNFSKWDLLNFWIRRWFRTIPNYLLILSVLLIYKQIVYKTLGDFNLKYFLFLQNFSSPPPQFFQETWSLSIEEWFYILFPLTYYVLYRLIGNNIKSILISALVFILVPMILRIIKYESGIGIDQWDMEYRKIIIFRLDSLMYGILAAYIFVRLPELWARYKDYCLILGILLLILIYFNPSNWKNSYLPLYFNIESITAFCFLPFLSLYKTTKSKMLDAFFIFISIISYSMYLLNHTPIEVHFIPGANSLLGRSHIAIEDNYISNYIAFWVITIVSSYLLYSWYEHPVTLLRDKLKLRNK